MCSRDLSEVDRALPVIGGEVQVLFDLQQDLSEEADALVFKLLPLLKHLLHVLHVLRGQLVKLFQRFLISFFSLQGGKQKSKELRILSFMYL